MPAYLLAGPAVALIGIVAIVFVIRHRSVQTRSMYSSRRSQMQHKVQAQRSRTLAPHGWRSHAPTDAEIAATPLTAAPPAYQAPVAPRQAWEMPAAPAYSPPPSPPSPGPEPPAPTFEPGPSVPAREEPSWTPAPAEESWTPAVAPEPAPAAAESRVPPQPVSTPAGGGASWEIVGDGTDAPVEGPPAGGKHGRKERAAAGATAAWQLASGDAPVEGGAEDVVKAPNPAMAIAQYAVLVVGLVMVLIGVLVMVANSKVT